MEDLERVEACIEKTEHCNSILDDAELTEQLNVLSEELDTLGLPLLDVQKPVKEIFESVVNNCFTLVQMYRNEISTITEINMRQTCNNSKTEELQKTISNLKSKLQTVAAQNKNLEQKIFKLSFNNEELHKKVSAHNTDTDKLKNYYKSKQNQMSHRIKNLENENQHLKEICGKDLGTYFNKEDKFLKLLKTYKDKDERYREVIQKLEHNNEEIMNEILNLRDELALAYLKE